MKKTVSLILAFTMLTSITSCSEKAKESSLTTEQTYTAEKLSDKAYKKEKLPQIEGLDTLFAVRNSSCGNLLLGSLGSDSPVFLMSDSEFQNGEKIVPGSFSIGVNYDVTLCSDGTIIAFVNEQDEDTEEYSYWVRKYSSSGELISEVEMTELYEIIEPSKILIDGMYCSDGKNLVVLINGCCYCINTDGRFIGELTLSDENQTIGEFGTDSNGQLWCTVKVDIENVILCKVDAENCKIDESGVIYNVGGSIIAPIMAGTGDYKMFLTGRTQIFGIKADGTIDALFSLLATDINVNLLSAYSFDENCQLLLPKLDSSSPIIIRYIEVDSAELENIPVLKIGCYDSGGLSKFAESVNDDQSDYRIEFVEYGESTNDFDTQKDFISGNIPDLIASDHFDKLKLDEKGVLCDLYELMDKDKEMNRDAFNSKLMSLAETDGSLYALYKDIGYSSMIGKTEFVGDNLNWSADDYINACENRPDDMYVYQKDNDYLSALNIDSFFDLKNKKCYFDSEEFLKICKFAESRSDYMDYNTEYDFRFADWEHPTEEELKLAQQISKEQSKVYADNKAMLMSGYGFNDFRGFAGCRYFDFYGADTAPVGYITPEGGQIIIRYSSGLSISTQCKNKELAWDVIKRYLMYREEWVHGYYNLSMVNSINDEAIQNALNPPEEFAGGGDYIHPITGEKMDVEFGQDDIDYIINLINNAKYTDIHILPDQCWMIYLEEKEKFENHEYTAEQFADILQNRLSIAVAE